MSEWVSKCVSPCPIIRVAHVFHLSLWLIARNHNYKCFMFNSSFSTLQTLLPCPLNIELIPIQWARFVCFTSLLGPFMWPSWLRPYELWPTKMMCYIKCVRVCACVCVCVCLWQRSPTQWLIGWPPPGAINRHERHVCSQSLRECVCVCVCMPWSNILVVDDGAGYPIATWFTCICLMIHCTRHHSIHDDDDDGDTVYFIAHITDCRLGQRSLQPTFYDDSCLHNSLSHYVSLFFTFTILKTFYG